MATDGDLIIYTDDETFQIVADDDGIELLVTAVGINEATAAQAAQAAAAVSAAAAAASAASITDDQIALKAQVFN
jgi:hypothetical protein